MSAARKQILIALAAFTLGLVAAPTQSSLQAGASLQSAYVSSITTSNGPSDFRRVAAEFCATEAEMISRLAEQGFYQMVLGENTGTHSLRLAARYGNGKFEALIDRCTGRLQEIVSLEKSELMYL